MSMITQRQEKLYRAIEAAGLAGFAVNAGNNLMYLTGLDFHLMERPVVAYFVPGQPVLLVLPGFESSKADACDFPVRLFPYSEDPSTWTGVFRQAAAAAGLSRGQVAVEGRGMRVLELRHMQAASPEIEFSSGDAIMAGLRLCKDEEEIAAMQRAVEIAEQALLATLPVARPGISEQEFAAELTIQLLRAGSNPPYSFAPLVGFGENSAKPHAAASGRQLRRGDLLLVDWGASYAGYISDLTRTFAVGEIDPEFWKIAEVVLESNAAGCRKGAPGVPAGSVDAASRSVIEAAGYGQYFHHRTGHGIGMDVHEEPYLFGANTMLLQPGMTYTVEPGIAILGRGAIRIEDNVVVTPQGCRVLSSLPRELQRID